MSLLRTTILPVAALMMLSACSTGEEVDRAKQAVATFHAQLNSKQIDSIWTNASEEYRKAVTPEQNLKLFTAIQNKLGDAGDCSVGGFNVFFSTSGTTVNLQCNTHFSRAEAQETFVWRMTGTDASLVNYHVSSPALE